MSQNEVARRLGIAKSTVAYHARNLGREPDERCNRRYDWQEVQQFYDEGHTLAECRERFGFSTETWYSARKRGDIVARPHGMPIDVLCAEPRSRRHLKLRLIAAGLLEPVCAECGIDSWLGRPLSLALHTSTATRPTTGRRTWSSGARTAIRRRRTSPGATEGGCDW